LARVRHEVEERVAPEFDCETTVFCLSMRPASSRREGLRHCLAGGTGTGSARVIVVRQSSQTRHAWRLGISSGSRSAVWFCQTYYDDTVVYLPKRRI
jgi:hypothetical protein